MQRHILIHKKPTYLNIPDVEKMGITTRKRTPKHNANTKHNAPQTQTCGRLKISTRRKEKVTPFIEYREVTVEQQTPSRSCLGG
jgi:hypothetical protein